jgi:6-phosphogluconolactonase
LSNLEIRVLADRSALADAIAVRLLTRIGQIQAERHHAIVCLTGGTTGTSALAALAASPLRDTVDWAQISFWWGDERYLAAGDPERNETGAREVLLDLVEVNQDQVHPMAVTGQFDTVEAAAASYARELEEAAPEGARAPQFDICLLGVGEDGHVASLFPGAPGVLDDRTAFAVHDSPKPPATRISLGLPTIQASREVWLLAGGAGKADPIRKALTTEPGQAPVPAALARGTELTLVLLDEAAAAQLPNH